MSIKLKMIACCLYQGMGENLQAYAYGIVLSAWKWLAKQEGRSAMSRKRKRQVDEGQIWKFIGIAVLIVFVGSILWSMWAETLWPLIEAGDSRAVMLHLIGLPLILIGVSIFVYGGYLFVRDTYDSYGDETLLHNMAIIRAKPSREAVSAARRQTLRVFWQAWKPGLARLGLGFLILAVGGFLINL